LKGGILLLRMLKNTKTQSKAGNKVILSKLQFLIADPSKNGGREIRINTERSGKPKNEEISDFSEIVTLRSASVSRLKMFLCL
jgi:hypothetical protein